MVIVPEPAAEKAKRKGGPGRGKRLVCDIIRENEEVDLAWDIIEEALERCAAEVAEKEDATGNGNGVTGGGFIRAVDPHCFRVLAAAGLRRVPLQYLTALLTEHLRTRAAVTFCKTLTAGPAAPQLTTDEATGADDIDAPSSAAMGARRQQEAVVEAVRDAESTLSRSLAAVAELVESMGAALVKEGKGCHGHAGELLTLQQELRQQFATAVFNPVGPSAGLRGAKQEKVDEERGGGGGGGGGGENSYYARYTPFGALVWMHDFRNHNPEVIGDECHHVPHTGK